MKNTKQGLSWATIGIVALAALLRLLLLGIKPPHFDEGVNGWFVDEMTKHGYYHYDPANYHGPLHFYLLFLFQTLLGRSVWALRLPVVAASVLAVWWATKFDRFLGRRASLFAGLAMAVSPGMVFYGRYAIHESEMVFFLMLMAWGIAGLWQFGERKYLWSLGLGLTGAILTKETWFIHIACFLLAWATLGLFEKLSSSAPLPCAAQQWKRKDLLAVIAAGSGLILFFYSGGFLDPILWQMQPMVVKGINRTVEFPGFLINSFWRPYAAWFQTGTNKEGGHVKTSYDLLTLHFGSKKAAFTIVNYYWLALITHYEWITLAGLIGVFRFLWPNSGRLIRYLAIYGCGALAAYSLVPYKTPWCIITIIWPFFFVFGELVDELFRAINSKADMRGVAPTGLESNNTKNPRALPWADVSEAPLGRKPEARLNLQLFAAVMLVVSLYMAATFATVRLNFFHYADEDEEYVYVQTLPDLNKLTVPLFKLTAQNPTNYHLAGSIIMTSYHPLPWVLGDFTAISYYEDNRTPGVMDADFLLVEDSRIEEVEKSLHHSYFTEKLRLRGGQDPSKLYLSTEKFSSLFPGRTPEFTSAQTAPKQP